jgi:tetraacyldisaccharide 4'-kinase
MNSKFIKILRWLLLPISFIYGLVVTFRNVLYKYNILKSNKPNIATICVGNISLGGTGKSPMVIYLAQLLQKKFQIAVLSRGYKRNSKGLLFFNSETTPNQIGEEPYMIAKAIPFAPVVVHENRVDGLQAIQNQVKNVNCVILDDAFQHRKLTALINVVLVDYNHPFYNDYYLPTGNLRDATSRMYDATMVVVTKCPNELSIKNANVVKSKMNLKNIPVYFATIKYHQPIAVFKNQKIALSKNQQVLLVSAIANVDPLCHYLKQNVLQVEKMEYADHHHFTQQNIDDIISKAKQKNAIVLTTDKDAVKLKAFASLESIDLYTIPITIQLLFNQANEFEEKILEELGKLN